MATTIPLTRIEIDRRLREISELQVQMLMTSIADIGLLNPVTVRERKIVINGRLIDNYALVVGRIEACKRLGMVKIPVYVVTLCDAEQLLADCDENLCARRIDPSEWGWPMHRRDDLCWGLDRETRNGGDRGAKYTGAKAARNDRAESTTGRLARQRRSRMGEVSANGGSPA